MNKIFNHNVLRKINKNGIIYNHSIMNDNRKMFIDTDDGQVNYDDLSKKSM